MYKFITLLCCLLLVACNTSKKKQEPEKTDSAKRANIAVKLKVTTSIPYDTIPKVTIPEGAVQVITNKKPDTAERIYLIDSSGYDSRLAPEFLVKKAWKGLFIAKDKFYIKDTKLKFSWYKEESDQKGRFKSDNKDSDAYFVSGANLIDGPINSIGLSKKRILPGEKEQFRYNDVIYTLYATGHNEENHIANYKLFLTANIKGHIFNQQIIMVDGFGSATNGDGDYIEDVWIQFVGDIDGDKIPDLIIDTFNVFTNSSHLYLSKLAGDNAILQHAAFVEVSNDDVDPDND